MQVFSVQQGASGWSVRHDQVPLAEGLSLGQAIKLARQAGRRHNDEQGHHVTVEQAKRHVERWAQSHWRTVG